MTKILKRSSFIFACAVSFCMALLPSCSGGASKPAETEQSTAPKSYQNGDLMVGGKKGEMWFQTYSGEKAFNGATFHFARDFYRGYAPVIKMVDGKELHGIINLKGEEVIKIEHPEPIDAYDNGYFQIGSMDKQGYLDSTGKLVIPMNYGRSKGVYDGLFVLQKGLNWGVVNANGQEVTPFIYTDAHGYADNGLMMVEKKYKCGFIDREGKEVIPCSYESATSFEQGVAIARIGEKYGLIDATNQHITGFDFDEFKFETTSVEDAGSQTGYSNVGKRIITEGGYSVFRKGKMWGAVNPKGEIVIPFEFDYMGSADAMGVNVGLGKRRGTYDLEKKEVKWLD
ncbi:MAG: WG repeat-containing protein [Bacteroidetes bacterium]|nr:WG repeat-containing protein [Bacteroidota bacterium]